MHHGIVTTPPLSSDYGNIHNILIILQNNSMDDVSI